MHHKKLVILSFLMLFCFTAFSQIIKKDDLKIKTYNRRPLYGSISGFIVNPIIEGVPKLQIKADYNIVAYEVQDAAKPAGSLFTNTKVAIVKNISDAIITFKSGRLDTFEYSITHLPLNKKIIIVFYNKNLNVDESIIKTVENNFVVGNAYFQNTRSIKWAADVEYQNNFVFTCSNAKSQFENIEISFIQQIITTPK